MSGCIVVLNGTSSSGKTTLAHAIRSAGGENWSVASIDKMFAMLHPSQANDWATYLALTKALFSSAKAMADSGFSVVVDTVFEREECLRVCQQVLGHLVLVGVRCPVSVLEEREHRRGNRPLGLAKGQVERVHAFCRYDLEVDTGELSPEEGAQLVLERVGHTE